TTTTAATLTVNAPACAAAPSITTQPSAQTVTAPAAATFTAAGSTPANCSAPTVQWSSEAPGAISFSAISGATSASYTTPSTTIAQSGTKYEATFTNAFGSTTTTAATLTVNAPASPTPIDPAGYLYGVACPSTSQCTAVDGYGREVTFDPNNPGRATPTTIDGPYALYAVACPSTSQCTAVDAQGGAVTFDPKKPGSPTRILAACTGAYA